MSTPTKGFHVLICRVFHEPIELKCAPDDTVYMIKQLFKYERWGYPPDTCVLIHKKVLCNDRTLRSYNVESGDKIHLLSGYPGGYV